MNGRTQKQLYEILHNQLNLSELRALAFRLGIDHENLPGDTRRDFVISLIETAQRHNKLAQLNQLVDTELENRDGPTPPSHPNKQNQVPLWAIGLVGLVILVIAAIMLWPEGNSATETPTPEGTILLQVQVVSSENQTAVSNAKVSLNIAEELFPQQRTDSNGLAVFRLEAQLEGEIARITVEANEQVETQTISVMSGMRAVEFQIRP
ncbi:MAG: hypothetical protein DHS20C20_23020 [Ardenticatenaceae bacterium]|nr:MAG: hypothetical protein DHS20C20_23020 [Ardenticatenaceae bacterium]